MRKYLLIVSFWLFIAQTAVYAAETTVSLELFDLNTQKPIKNVLITIALYPAAGEAIQFSKYIASNILTFDVQKGRYEITLKVDDLETEGKDYFLKERLEVSTNTSSKVQLYNIGSISGTVIDQLNNLVSNADLKFECAAEYGEERPMKTDKYGSFALQYAPVGRCKITAYRSNMVGSETLVLERGQNNEVVVHLRQKTASKSILPYIIGAIVLIVAIIIFMKRSKTRKSTVATERKENINHRTIDIIETLKEKEQNIVKAIMESGNESTQARLKSATGIPKTSLSRILETLKTKKILEIESHGKLKKVRLTSWFLGKEN